MNPSLGARFRHPWLKTVTAARTTTLLLKLCATTWVAEVFTHRPR
ncbi:MAG: hypothetical protein Q7U82_03980 [Gammaproteobacteria bacterium]|nr:hypothetical protein [Gammaproteobacteria bacterium]